MIDEQKEFNSDLDSDFDFTLSEDTLNGSESEDIPAADSAQTILSEKEKSEKAYTQSLFNRIPVTLTLEVASAEISLAELMSIDNESIIELDKLAGEPLDVKVNGILFGKAEVVVLNDKYGLRIIEFNNRNLGELTL